MLAMLESAHYAPEDLLCSKLCRHNLSRPNCEREGLIDSQTANIYIGNITLTGTQGRIFYTILLIDLLLLLG